MCFRGGGDKNKTAQSHESPPKAPQKSYASDVGYTKKSASCGLLLDRLAAPNQECWHVLLSGSLQLTHDISRSRPRLAHGGVACRRPIVIEQMKTAL